MESSPLGILLAIISSDFVAVLLLGSCGCGSGFCVSVFMTCAVALGSEFCRLFLCEL